jgi:hypothetical protein
MKTTNTSGHQAVLKSAHLLASKPNPVRPQVKKPVAAKKETSKAKTAPTTKPAAKVETAPRNSISAFVRENVLKGLDNAAIWKLAQPKFVMPDDHKWFIGWYRASFVRKGLITKAQATPKAVK